MINSLLRYLAAGLVFVIILLAVVFCGKYSDSLAITVSVLQRARANLMNVRDIGRAAESSLSSVERVLPSGMTSTMPEERLFEGLDALKEKMTGADLTVDNPDRKNDEVSLPVQIKSDMRNYTDFVNTVGYLQSLKYPFFSITSISLSQAKDKERAMVRYEIKGVLRMPKGVL